MTIQGSLAGPALAAALGEWGAEAQWHLEPQWLRLLHEAIAWDGDASWVPQLGIVAAHFRTAVRPAIPLERPATRLNAGQVFRFRRPLCPGEVVTIRARLLDAVERQGRTGELLFVTTEIAYTGPDGDEVGSCHQTTVHRPQAGEARDGGVPRQDAVHPASDLAEPGRSAALPACDPRRLVQWAAASGDLNPLHYDADQARREGYPGVIVTGSLKVALLEAALQRCWPGRWLRFLEVRHRAWDRAGGYLEARWVRRADGRLDAEVGPAGCASLTAQVELGET